MDRYPGRARIEEFYLIILSGRDVASLWRYYNARVRYIENILYEPQSIERLIWILDRTHSDEIVARIPVCYIYLSSATDEMVRIIERRHYNRKLEWHIFEKGRKLEHQAPKSYYFWSEGVLNDYR